MTVGLEVLVQDVIAAIATEPCPNGGASLGSPATRVARRRAVGLRVGRRGSSSPQARRARPGPAAGAARRATARPSRGRARARVELRARRPARATGPAPWRSARRGRPAPACRPVSRRYDSVSSSIGNSVAVAPNSGLMFEIVARSASDRPARPSPANSTNAPDHAEPAQHLGDRPARGRSRSSRAAARRCSRTPTMRGIGWYSGWPRSTASASMPPTP